MEQGSKVAARAWTWGHVMVKVGRVLEGQVCMDESQDNTSSGNSRLLHLWEEEQSWCLDKQTQTEERGTE